MQLTRQERGLQAAETSLHRTAPRLEEFSAVPHDSSYATPLDSQRAPAGLLAGGFSLLRSGRPRRVAHPPPAKFILDGPAAEQRLVLELADGKTLLGQVTNPVTFTSSNPKVVRIEDGLAIAVGNGTATVTGKSGRNYAKAELRVVNMEKPFEWRFRNHVQPALTKTGCNSGMRSAPAEASLPVAVKRGRQTAGANPRCTKRVATHRQPLGRRGRAVATHRLNRQSPRAGAAPQTGTQSGAGSRPRTELAAVGGMRPGPRL
jgi:hypothetical protein